MSRVMNMTEGRPAKLMLKFALPVVLTNLGQQLYQIVDAAIVGRGVGVDALAAVGCTDWTYWMVMWSVSVMTQGFATFVSRYFGKQDVVKINKAITTSVYLSLIISALFVLIGVIGARPILVLLRTPEAILPQAVTYLTTMISGIVIVAFYNLTAAILRAFGDSKSPLAAMIIAAVMNVALDLLFVLVFHWGVFGAAFATILAQMVSGIGCLLFALKTNSYFRLNHEDLQLDRGIIRQSVRLGLPMALQWSLISVSSTILQTFVNSFGPAAMAAFTATNRIESFVHMPFGSISSALSTYAGQNFGAHDMKRVKEGFRHGMLISTVIIILLFVMFQLLSEPLMRLFVKEDEVILLGAQALKMTSWFYIFLALIYTSRSLLNGVGDAIFALMNGVVEVACRIIIPLVLVALLPALGVMSIWWATVLTWITSSIFCLLRYYVWNKKADFSKSVV